jgi:hypothetical protein
MNKFVKNSRSKVAMAVLIGSGIVVRSMAG